MSKLGFENGTLSEKVSAVRVKTSALWRDAVFRRRREMNKKGKIGDEIWNLMIE